jgi:hypothetical protein
VDPFFHVLLLKIKEKNTVLGNAIPKASEQIFLRKDTNELLSMGRGFLNTDMLSSVTLGENSKRVSMYTIKIETNTII